MGKKNPRQRQREKAAKADDAEKAKQKNERVAGNAEDNSASTRSTENVVNAPEHSQDQTAAPSMKSAEPAAPTQDPSTVQAGDPPTGNAAIEKSRLQGPQDVEFTMPNRHQAGPPDRINPLVPDTLPSTQQKFHASSTSAGNTASSKSYAPLPTSPHTALRSVSTPPTKSQTQTTAASFATLMETKKPAAGSEGVRVPTLTNHFRADLRPLNSIYRYDVKVEANHTVQRRKNGTTIVTVTPRNTPRKIRRVLLSLLALPDFESAATDYVQVLVSLKPLTQSKDLAREVSIDLLEEGQTMRAREDSCRSWKVILTPTQKDHVLNVQTLLQFLGGTAMCDNKAEILNALNLIVSRRPLQSGLVTLVGKDRFFDNRANAENLGEGLCAKIGYNRSVRALAAGPFLQINASAAAFYQSGTMARLLDERTPVQGQFNITAKRSWQDQHLMSLERFISGLRVRANFGQRKYYSVWGFSKPTVPGRRPTPGNVHFDQYNDQGQLIQHQRSVGDYFLKVLNVTDVLEDALVINVGTRDHPISIPCDRLNVLPVNAYRRLLDVEQTGKMVKFAGRIVSINKADIAGPGARMFGIGMNDIDSLMRRFNIDVNQQMLPINARRLITPMLRYLTYRGTGEEVERRPVGLRGVQAGLQRENFPTPSNGSWTLRNQFFPRIGKVPKCAWVEFHEGSPSAYDQGERWGNFIEQGLIKYCSYVGEKATLNAIPSNEFGAVMQFPADLDSLQRIFAAAKEAGYDVVFVLLQTKNAKNYDNIKYVADVKVGIHTVCTVQTPKWRRGQTAKNGKEIPQVKFDWDFVTNEMLKVNLKMGGINTHLALDSANVPAEIRRLLSRTTMIVGADVTHPGPGSMDGANSIAAVVASVESTFSQYPASIRCQNSKVEMIGKLDLMLEERLKTWANHNNGELPNQILFFRDGVSEDQYDTIRTEELPLIERAFKTVYGNRRQPHPKLLFVCIVKRVHTRFFPVSTPNNRREDPNIDHKTGNAWPGLVVDTHITYPRGYDFYMQSQRALQGTAKPAHYVVLVDEIQVSVDNLQKAIFWQCWTYQRSLKPISVHPAARLADRACNRARSYLRDVLVGNETTVTMDRGVNGNAADAWMSGVHGNLKDSTFYI